MDILLPEVNSLSVLMSKFLSLESSKIEVELPISDVRESRLSAESLLSDSRSLTNSIGVVVMFEDLTKASKLSLCCLDFLRSFRGRKGPDLLLFR